MATDSAFALDSKLIGALPIVNHFLRRMRIDETLRRHLPAPDARYKLTPQQALGVLLRNLIVTRVPLYAMEEWAEGTVPSLLGLSADQLRLLNDDRVGRRTCPPRSSVSR